MFEEFRASPSVTDFGGYCFRTGRNNLPILKPLSNITSAYLLIILISVRFISTQVRFSTKSDFLRYKVDFGRQVNAVARSKRNANMRSTVLDLFLLHFTRCSRGYLCDRGHWLIKSLPCFGPFAGVNTDQWEQRSGGVWTTSAPGSARRSRRSWGGSRPDLQVFAVTKFGYDRPQVARSRASWILRLPKLIRCECLQM